MLFCVVITFFAVTLAPSGRDSVLHSSSGHYIALLLNRADPMIPGEIHKVLDPYLNRLETELQPDGATPPRTTGSPPREAEANRMNRLGAWTEFGTLTECSPWSRPAAQMREGRRGNRVFPGENSSGNRT